jgi:hypothetical protein
VKGEVKPEVELVGRDGNAFSIMAACSRAARKAGWTTEEIEEVTNKMKSGDYDNLLQVANQEFDVS